MLKITSLFRGFTTVAGVEYALILYREIKEKVSLDWSMIVQVFSPSESSLSRLSKV